MNTNKYELAVQVNGKNIVKHSHQGKFYIEGRNGTEYTLKVRNNTGRRVLAVVSVDGVNVVDGTPADNQTTGYLVDAYCSIDIKGYRESDTRVGAFKFVTKDHAYAKETTGSDKNSGVIGCMIIEEKQKVIDRSNWSDWHNLIQPNMPYKCGDPYSVCTNHSRKLGSIDDSSASYSADLSVTNIANDTVACYSAQAAPTKAPNFDLGSTWGHTIYDKVLNVEFERGALLETLVLYYASKTELEAIGIQLTTEKAISFPEPFPGKFCTPPKSYREY